MHADFERLIALRDGEPMDARWVEHVAGCTACSRRLAHLRRTREMLAELPAEAPPPETWERIRERAALGLAAPPPRGRLRWVGGLLAASLAVAALAFALVHAPFADRRGSRVERAGEPAAAAAPDLAGLQRRSRQLENLLDALGPEPNIVSLRAAGAVNELEDGIWRIDDVLSSPTANSLHEVDRRRLWEQRVDLLESLVTVRAAQRQANGI